MKIGIIGDTHRNSKYIDLSTKYLKDCDLILHTGDNFADSRYIYQVTNVNTLGVKGNCDFEDVEEEIIFEVEGLKILLCHGHRYNVKYDLKTIKKEAKNKNVNIVVFGHSHEYINLCEENIMFLNPGSVSLPRGSHERSFMILDIKNGNVDVSQILL